MIKKNVIIIGAGLSGLYLATLLKEKFNVTVLEARNRLGGRILTTEGHDLGPSWVWSHQKHILALIQDLGLELFAQYAKGDALYDSPEGLQRFKAPPSAPSARMVGGLEELIKALALKLAPDTVHLNEEVTRLSYKDNGLEVETIKTNYKADYVLSTLAPRLACEHIEYLPPLPLAIKEQLLSTPTWMGNSVKCVVEFEKAFWKEEGLSGFVYSPLGPLGEIHDASTQKKAALFGFVNAKNSLEKIEDELKEQMKRLFADKSELIRKIYCVSWKNERFSSSQEDNKVLSAHPNYGLNLSHFNNKLLFMGTETAFDNGGYLEGALVSALEVVKKLEQEEQSSS